MIRILFTFILFCFFSSILGQVKVLDSISKKPIPFVAVTFDDNNGLYTNQIGEFDLNVITKDTIVLYSLGYKQRTVSLKLLKDQTIYLVPINIALNEIVVSNKKKKSKSKKVKPIKHNDFLKSYGLLIGEEMAIYVPNNQANYDNELKNILIPVVTKTISFEKSFVGKSQRIKKLPFSALFKISFYQNIEGIPGEKLYDEIITIKIDEKLKIASLDLENYDIEIPKEGFFVGMLNLGKTDINGKLISSSPFVYKKIKNKTKKVLIRTKPFFPIYFKEKSHKTYLRYTFSKNKVWKPLVMYGSMKKYKFHNISLGYEIKMYLKD